MVAQIAADDETQGAADRCRQIKQAHHATANVFREQIGEESGRYSDEGRLANTDDDVTQEQFVIGVRNRTEQGSRAPNESAGGHDPFS